MSLMLLGVTILEGRGICWESKLFNFWAKCTYAIYLTHWFAVIVADRIVAESGNSRAVAIALILLTPAVVTYVSVLVYVYFEAPLTRYLTDRFSKAVQRPS